MIDVSMDEGAVLSTFDAGRPFDAAFIQSFLNILSSSSCGFKNISENSFTDKVKRIACL